jgi:hypothetical protein
MSTDDSSKSFQFCGLWKCLISFIDTSSSKGWNSKCSILTEGYFIYLNLYFNIFMKTDYGYTLWIYILIQMHFCFLLWSDGKLLSGELFFFNIVTLTLFYLWIKLHTMFGSFLPLPPAPPLPPTPSLLLPIPRFQAENVLPLSLILLKRKYKQ